MTERQRFEQLHRMLLSGPHALGFAGKIMAYAAQHWPEKEALICGLQHITYQELYARTVACSLSLRAAGIKPRNRVVIIYENSIEFYVGYYGAWQCGAIVVPVNSLLSGQEMAGIIADCTPTHILASATQQEKCAAISNELPFYTDDLQRKASPEEVQQFTPFSLEPDECAALLYTSGTTGKPKGVMLSSRNIFTNIAQGLSRLATKPDGRILCPLPLFHSFMQIICVWGAPLLGATVIIVAKIDRRALIQGLSYNPAVILAVPALYGIFCRMKTLKFPNVDYFISGGDALPDKIALYFAILYRRKICNGYGMTETSPLIAVHFDETIPATNTVGPLVEAMQLQLRDENNSIMSSGIGTLWVKGDNVMLGYYNAPDATYAILKDGWLNTGDLAYLDEFNNIIICGRDKDLIVNKGIKIYPQEVENIIMSHPHVFMVAVVGKPDEHGNEIPIAFVATREQSPTLPEELATLCQGKLAPYKVPRTFIVRSDLPMTATGKVDKKVVRKELQETK